MILALYGGSFNPPHNGHVALARHALKAVSPDKLIWMPAGDPPHKKLPKGTPSATHRLAMSRLAVRDLPDTGVGEFELSGGARYTIDTVKMLTERYKPDELWLLMGQDMRDSFDTWRKADELLELCKIYVFPRTMVPVSSTEIRALLALGQGEDMLPPAVYQYIRTEGLYGCPKP